MSWKNLSTKDKIKKIAKYVVNTLNMINALIIVLSPIWGWQLDSISKTIIGVAGVISAYLVGGKLFEVEEIISEEDLINENNEE